MRFDRLTSITSTLLLTIALIACSSSSDFGRMERAPELTDMFRLGEVLPNHTYYYVDTPANVHTVIAIDNSYRLNAPRWRKWDDVNGRSMRRWTAYMRNTFNTTPRGRWIYDHWGNRFGAWYSSANPTTVRGGEGNEVRISPPMRPKMKNEVPY